MQSNASKNADSTEKKLTSGKDQRGSQLEEEFSRQFLHGQTNMELEHQDMLTRNLGLRKKKLLQLSTPFFLENNKLELRNCSSKLFNEFETGLNNYQKLLDEIQGGPTVNLNNLTVF